MKYLNTNYRLFKESKEHISKYEIVTFNEEYTIDNIYGIDRNLSVTIKKGEKVKLFFDIKNSKNESFNIIALRPIETLTTEKNSLKTKFSLSELWEGNFILNNPLTINKKDNIFTIEKYI